MNSVSRLVQAHPARPNGIVRPCRYDHAGVVVGRVLQAANDPKLARGAGALSGADRDGKFADRLAVLNYGELPVGNADDNAPFLCCAAPRETDQASQ